MAKIWWEQLREDANDDWIFFIHQIDHGGEIIANDSIPLRRRPPPQSDKPIRRDAATISLAADKLVSGLGVGFFSPQSGALAAGEGNRDFDGHRLLLPLPGRSRPTP